MAKKKPVVFAITSDHHCGSTVGLCPQRVELDDGGSYVASKAQNWLEQGYHDFWSAAGLKSTELDAELIAVFNGDMTDGDHHGTTQILSGNPTAQASVVNSMMEYALGANPHKMVFIRGTEAHVGKSACFEERIALGLLKDGRPVIKDRETGTASHWHFRCEKYGVRLDFAHHGVVGQMPWSYYSTSNLAARIFYEHAKAEVPHPHLAIRSHMHQFVDTGNLHPVRVIQTPCWQLRTAYVHKIDTTGKLPDIGGVLVTILPTGRYEVEPILFKPSLPKAVQL